MEEKPSTFESLVATLSKDETKDLLAKISSSMQTIQKEKVDSPLDLEEKGKTPLPVIFEKESILLKLWLKFLSLINSIPVETLYQRELIKRIGRSLKLEAGEYIDVSKQLYTEKFYGSLLKLQKTHAFFCSALECYNTEKSNFYMLLVSFFSPELYEKLIKVSSHFEENDENTLPTKKNAILKEIERLTAALDVNTKTQMYQISQAIEWMRTFCDFSLDKVLAKFSIQNSSNTCSFLTIQNEIELLASILASSKNIPTPMLQTLFLLQQKGEIPLDSSTQIKQDESEVEKNASKFIEDAMLAISYIEEFTKNIPIKKIVKYIKQDVTWTPIEFRAGEDWFLYFKHAWKDFFLQRWTEWMSDVQKLSLTKKMLEITGKEELQVLKNRPWVPLLGQSLLKNEALIQFFKTFFETIYREKVEGVLKTILAEGTFYRSDVLSSFSNTYTILSQGDQELEEFENELSPQSVIGSSFNSIIQNGALTIKTKNQLESLIKNIENDMKRIADKLFEALNSIHSLLSSIAGSETTHIVLTNWSSIQGGSNKKFQEEVVKVNTLLANIIDVLKQMGLTSL